MNFNTNQKILNETYINEGSDELMVLCQNQQKKIIKTTVSKEEFLQILYNSDLKKSNKYGWTAAMYFCIFGNLYNIEKKDYEYLIQNSNYQQINSHEKQLITYIIRYFDSHQMTLNNNILNDIFNQSDLSLIDKDEMHQLKKIQSVIQNEKILQKIQTKENFNTKIIKL